MIDVSDGLGADAAHLARAGGCRLEIALEKVPVAEGVAAIAGGERAALELAAAGGEDFELLAMVPAERVDEASGAVSATGSTLTEIGYATEGEGIDLRLPGGEELEARGFDHRRESGSGSASGSGSG
jgi:thiamine-monophosphate kinase